MGEGGGEVNYSRIAKQDPKIGFFGSGAIFCSPGFTIASIAVESQQDTERG